MGIPDPIKNCALEICCLDVAKAQAAYAKWLVSLGIPEEYAKRCAAETYEYFELAERGTLTAFKQSIIRLYNART